MKNIIFFVKYPHPGKVKTRLARFVGETFAADLYSRFVTDILEMLGTLDAKVFVFFGGNVNKEKVRSWIKKDYPLIRQQGNDLGERMYNAFDHVFRAGHRECLIIGSDSPDLPADIYNEAFDRLKEADMVIGPSSDGGYYLMGLHEASLDNRLFQNIAWSSEQVCFQTLEKARELKYRIHSLPEWEDVDMPENMLNLYERALTGRFHNSHTMILLKQNQLLANKLSEVSCRQKPNFKLPF